MHKKEIAIGAASAATAIGLYGAYSLYKQQRYAPSGYRSYGIDAPLADHLDDYSPSGATFKAGQKLQRVSASAIEDFREKGFTYVSHLFRDNQGYKTSFRKEHNIDGQRDFVHTIRPKRDIRIASPRTAAETFARMYPKSNDMLFRQVVRPFYTGPDNDDPFDLYVRERRLELVSELKAA